MRQLITVDDSRAFKADHANQRIALVPTMGALHKGHMALVETARQHADIVIVSIFVNPLQFGPTEDYTRYPRPLEDDLAACQAAGVDAVFTPTVDTLYPNGANQPTTVIIPPPELTDVACGLSRPAHFMGVCTVVAKLFNLIQPHVAVFGEKDAQQLAILRRMARDLAWSVELIAHPLEREASGLAISSRNQYLTDPTDRNAALLLSRWLNALAPFGELGLPPYEAFGIARQMAFAGVPEVVTDRFELDYITAVDEDTFLPVQTLSPNSRILLAAWIGDKEYTDQPRVRLIDNHLLSRGVVPVADMPHAAPQPTGASA